MKRKLLLSGFGVLLSALSFAQITIQKSDFGVPGDTIYYAIDSTFATPVPIGAGGANKTWNFTTVASPDAHDVNIIYDASFDPNAPIGANTVVTSEINDPMYFNIDTLAARVILDNPLGAGDPISFRIADFPLTYNKSFADTSNFGFKGAGSDFGFPQVDSIWLKVEVVNQVNVDGWGNLVTSNGTKEVLRVKNNTLTNVQIYGKGLVTLYQWVKLNEQNQPTQTMYSFLGKNASYFVAQATVDSLDNIVDFTYQEAKPNNTGIKTVSAVAIGLETYPNPANNELNVRFENKAASLFTVQLTDLTGKVIMQETTTNNHVTLQTANMSNGIYFCRVSNSNTSAVLKVTVSK